MVYVLVVNGRRRVWSFQDVVYFCYGFRLFRKFKSMKACPLSLYLKTPNQQVTETSAQLHVSNRASNQSTIHHHQPPSSSPTRHELLEPLLHLPTLALSLNAPPGPPIDLLLPLLPLLGQPLPLLRVPQLPLLLVPDRQLLRRLVRAPVARGRGQVLEGRGAAQRRRCRERCGVGG